MPTPAHLSETQYGWVLIEIMRALAEILVLGAVARAELIWMPQPDVTALTDIHMKVTNVEID
jgi:hypothetical protein